MKTRLELHFQTYCLIYFRTNNPISQQWIMTVSIFDKNKRKQTFAVVLRSISLHYGSCKLMYVLSVMITVYYQVPLNV
jgi:hypothetical protein